MATEKENISRIREILIGGNIAEIEKRFQKQDTYFRDELQLTVRNLHEMIEKDRSGFEQQFQKNEKDQNDLQKRLFESISSLKNHVESIADLMEAHKHAVSVDIEQLKKAFEEQQHQQKQYLLQAMTDMHTVLLKKIGDMQLSKVDKSAMALLMSEMAYQLSEQGTEDNGDEPADKG